MDTPKVIFNALKTDGGHAFSGKVTFNRVTLNEGHGMRSNGFTAPIAGHYKFSFSANGGLEIYGKDTWVHVLKNGRKLANWSIGDSDNNQWSDGNNISHDWIWKLNKNDKVTFEVQRGTYLSGLPRAPVNFNGQLVLVEA